MPHHRLAIVVLFLSPGCFGAHEVDDAPAPVPTATDPSAPTPRPGPEGPDHDESARLPTDQGLIAISYAPDRRSVFAEAAFGRPASLCTPTFSTRECEVFQCSSAPVPSPVAAQPVVVVGGGDPWYGASLQGIGVGEGYLLSGVLENVAPEATIAVDVQGPLVEPGNGRIQLPPAIERVSARLHAGVIDVEWTRTVAPEVVIELDAQSPYALDWHSARCSSGAADGAFQVPAEVSSTLLEHGAERVRIRAGAAERASLAPTDTLLLAVSFAPEEVALDVLE